MVLTVSSCNDNTRLTDYLNRLIQNEHYTGFVVLVDRPGKPLWEKAFGYANLETKAKAETTDLYRIASTTKTFIATLVVRLAIESKLNLDGLLTDYLNKKTLRGIANTDGVTIRQLLGMQSGIYNYTDNPKFETFVEQNPQHNWAASDALKLARDMPAEFAVGSASKYSNTNYILLGLVIEAVTGRPLVQVLQKQIFEPLKLNNTYLDMHQTIPRPIVPGYVYNKGQYKNISKINDGRGLADGGIVTDARDLNRFIRSLMTDDQFMPPKWRAQMVNFHPMRSKDRVEYGMGLIRFSDPDTQIIGHDGDDTGYQSWMIYLPATQTSVIFLNNNNPPRLKHAEFMKAFKAGMQ